MLSKSEVNIRYLSDALATHHVTACRSHDELVRHIVNADLLIAQNKGFTFRTIDDAVLTHAQRLRLIQHAGVQWDITDLSAATLRNIPVAVVPGENTRAVAEHAFHLVLCSAKRARRAQESLRRGTLGEVVSVELAGKSIAIVGFGRIGRSVAKMAQAFSMRVIAVDAKPSADAAMALKIDAMYPATMLRNALATADFVVLTLPLNAETFDLIGQHEFAAMKRGAILVNVSRGPHVNRKALLGALKSGTLSGFAADVFWEEPADPNDPILKDQRVYFTPHIAGQSHEVLTRVAAAIRENAERLAAGQQPMHIVNGVAARVH